MLDVSELTRLALLRASAAVEAVQLMGRTAVLNGFLGADWDDNDALMLGEKSIPVPDGTDVSLFDVFTDDRGASAI